MSYWTQTKLIDKYGFVVENTPMDEQRVVTPVRLVGVPFNGSAVDANFWTAAGTVVPTQAANAATIDPGTTASATSILTSVRKGRYMPGASNRFRASIALANTTATNNTRRWGVFDGNDGYYFKLTGGILYACAMKTNGTETSAVASTSWNGSTTLPTLTNVVTYEIYFTNSKAFFVMNGVLMHTIDSTATATPTGTLNLPVKMDSINAGSTASAAPTITCRIASIYRLGEYETLPTYKLITGGTSAVPCKVGPGYLHEINILTSVNNATIIIADSDGTTSAAMGTITLPTSAVPFNMGFHVSFYNGLIITPSSGTLQLLAIYE